MGRKISRSRVRLVSLLIAVAVVGALLSLQADEAGSDLVTNTLTPVADAYVDSSAPTTNFGTNARLVADASPVRESLLRFDLSSLSGPVQEARLRIHVANVADAESPSGGIGRAGGRNELDRDRRHVQQPPDELGRQRRVAGCGRPQHLGRRPGHSDHDHRRDPHHRHPFDQRGRRVLRQPPDHGDRTAARRHQRIRRRPARRPRPRAPRRSRRTGPRSPPRRWPTPTSTATRRPRPTGRTPGSSRTGPRHASRISGSTRR